MTTKNELKILTILDNNFQSALDHPTWTSFARNAKKDFEYRENKQWTSDEIAEIEKRGQAPITENEISPILERIIGQYKRQKTRIIFRGRNLGSDEETNNIMSDLALHAQQQSDYEFEEGDMFDDSNVCGFGVIRVTIEFDDILDPNIKIEHDDVLDMFPDPYSRRYDWNKDAEHVSRAKWVQLDEARKLYPEKKNELNSFINLDIVNTETANFKKDNYFDDQTQRVRLVEQEYKTRVKKQIVFFGMGETKDVTDWTASKRKQFMRDNPSAKPFERVDTEMKVGVFCGRVLLDHKDSPYNHNLFTWVPYFIKRKKDGEPYSMVRLLIDPQTEINKRRSKALHLLNTNQTFAEQGAVADKDEWNREMAKPDGFLEYKAGRKVEIQKNIEVAATQLQLLGESKQAIARISGISDESMARHSEIRSGVGLQRKQAMTDIIIMPIWDNLRRSRLMTGRLIFENIKQYYTQERIFQVTDDLGQSRDVELQQKHIDVLKEATYDTVIEEMPDTTTIQDEQFRGIHEMLRSMNLPPNFAMALLPILIRLSQIRGKEEILEQIKNLSQPAPELPKISLQLVWSELHQVEKANFASLMGFEQLAEFELQQGDQAAHKTKEQASIVKEQIKQGGNGQNV